MTDTATPVQPAAPANFADALRDPRLLVSRRGEIVKLAAELASQLAATARAQIQSSTAAAAARTQDLRNKANAAIASAVGRFGPSRLTIPTTLRRAAHDQLQRAAGALQELAKRIQPSPPSPQELPPANRAE
jgi:hypothetical protein